MNRELFKTMLETTECLDRSQIEKITVDSIESNASDGFPKGHRNLIIVMEELAELTQEISKELRGKEDPIGLLEELADVALGIIYVQKVIGIPDDVLQKAMSVKMTRLASKLYADGQYL